MPQSDAASAMAKTTSLTEKGTTMFCLGDGKDSLAVEQRTSSAVVKFLVTLR